MSDLSISEQRQRAGVSPSGRMIRRGPPTDREQVRVDGVSYPTVGEEEEVDPKWLAAHAERVREEWGGARREMTDAMRAARRKLPPVIRLEQALSRMARVSNLRARPLAAERSTSEDAPGGRCPPGSGENDYARFLTVIHAAVESLEHALDVEEGIAPGRSAALMSTTEKDRELFTVFAGVPAQEVSDVRPEMGHKRTVYKRRQAAGLDARGLDPETGMAPTVDRVNVAVLQLSRPERRAA